MIALLDGFPGGVLGFTLHGLVTKQDYDTVLVPPLEDALKRHDRLRLYCETAADFTGFAPGAVWEDMKIGLEHRGHWERVAIVTDVGWIRNGATLSSVLSRVATRCFPSANAGQAREWIAADLAGR